MLAILRFVVVLICCILICLWGTIYSLFHFRNPDNVRRVGQWFGRLHVFFGLKLERRFNPKTPKTSAIYIANHQNNFDMVTVSYMLRPRTVSIGKKSLMYIPLFNFVYWATGNILIDRNNRTKAHNTMNEIALRIREKNISIFMFPEGTRSRGRGLLPFKTGAFYTAIEVGLPIVPIVCTNLHNKVKWNQWDNGKVICEELDPIDTSNLTKEDVRELAKRCHDLMEARIKELNLETETTSK